MVEHDPSSSLCDCDRCYHERVITKALDYAEHALDRAQQLGYHTGCLTEAVWCLTGALRCVQGEGR